jgi:hypothetical protein
MGSWKHYAVIFAVALVAIWVSNNVGFVKQFTN